MAKIVKMENNAGLLDDMQKLLKKHGGKSGIMIVETKDQQKIAVANMSAKKARENLCLAIFYNEKKEMEK